MRKVDKATRKSEYFLKLTKLFDEFPKCFIVGVDNVGSKQMQQIRLALRGEATVLNGKNTMIRKAIRLCLENNPDLEKILPYIKENIGFVFTNGDLCEVRDRLLDNKVAAPAKAGAIAPCDVIIPAQNTGMGPEKTSFFQALQIPTKISKGTIEIVSDIHLIKKDDKVGASEAALLNMLKISPFTYGLVVRQVFDEGSCYAAEVLDITDEKLRESVQAGITQLAALSLAIDYPTTASAPHSFINGFKKLISLCAGTEDLSFTQADTLLEILRDPTKLAAATAAAASSAPAAGGDDQKAPEKEPEPEEESDDDMGFGLFD